MKLRIVSDLHVEFLGDYHSHPADNGRDWNSYTVIPQMGGETEQTLVLAGDIIMLTFMDKFYPLFRDISKRFKEVIVICGNHEFYRYQFIDAYNKYREFLKEWPNITLLQNESIERENIAIFGATLWTNFNRGNPFDMGYAEGAMGDFKVIEFTDRIWRPEDSVKEHETSVFLLNEFFKTYDGMKKVVITHHLPSLICNDPRFKGSPLNPAFSSDLDHIIFEEKPDLWIFGHTHHSSDQILGDTRLVSNPRGYYNGRENTKFNSKLVIEL